ncbi:hypothetical protein TWF102_004070 [Orbilia oligospora]|uniref:Uncharacterized protein n=1 Tax=Orbilia oligospora TaxID=2813651 RepID=A0A7C8NB18_ORBOL|nr:hypothetical protein TWF706_009104 [Orbilia oligospora]KAF3100270.1 hypothetical protein TWF103_008290 [Orbilia oligospora]KAF3112669.1 hypothetical protein TWF102_004070 [Orbilia oligospora]KAF3123273.1 hypothetical protein TWF594_002491 [Orbilia oligospora]
MDGTEIRKDSLRWDKTGAVGYRRMNIAYPHPAGPLLIGGNAVRSCIDIPVGPVRTWRGSSQLHAVCSDTDSRIAKSLREV